MEKKNKRPLINELTQGKELASQLKNHLDKTTSLQACDFLVEKILTSYEKALSMLSWNASLAGEPLPLSNSPNTTMESPNSFGETSPTSDNSDLDSKDQCKNNAFKKRKTMPKWSEQVRTSSGTMAEGPLGDGYSWRKYGQKDILGANYPRAYYRCTHRHVQGCLATKQVQRSDEDSSVFEVTYRGRHTCIQTAQLSTALASVGEKKAQKPMFKHQGILESHPQEMHPTFGDSCLNIAEDGFGKIEKFERFPSFSFLSTTPMEPEQIDQGDFFLDCIKEDSFIGSYSPLFISPAHNLQYSDSDLTDIISAPTSVSNSQITDFDFPLDQVDFPFDNVLLEQSEFYS